MKRVINISFILISILMFSTSCKDDSQIEKILEQQATIDKLNSENLKLLDENEELKSEYSEKTKNSSPEKPLNSNVSFEKIDTGNQKQAISAVKNYLEMYHSGKEYDNLKAVSKTDGTVDIILDIITRYGEGGGSNEGEIWFRSKKYYNVSTFSDDTYKINREWGIFL